MGGGRIKKGSFNHSAMPFEKLPDPSGHTLARSGATLQQQGGDKPAYGNLNNKLWGRVENLSSLGLNLSALSGTV